MQLVKSLLYMTVILIFFYLLYCIQHASSQESATEQLNKRLPNFQLPDLWQPDLSLTQNDLNDKISLLVIWASWCGACKYEHDFLMELSQTRIIPIYSIIYNDNRRDAQAWLNGAGNPFIKTGIDYDGAMGRLLQVRGTPTLFLIDKGIIRYEFLGALTQDSWEKSFLPLIRQYNQRQ